MTLGSPRLLPIVAIVGIDGAGKTTAAQEVARRLRARGITARYFENPGLRPPLNWLGRRLGHADAVDWLGVARFQAIEHRVRKAAMWRAVLWSRLPGERTAVMDRYTVCQYAAIRTRAAAGEDDVRASYRGLPAPDLTVFLDVAPAEAQRRVELRGRDSETLGYLVAADAAYRSLPEWAGFTVLDASAPGDDVVAAIVELVAPEARC